MFDFRRDCEDEDPSGATSKTKSFENRLKALADEKEAKPRKAKLFFDAMTGYSSEEILSDPRYMVGQSVSNKWVNANASKINKLMIANPDTCDQITTYQINENLIATLFHRLEVESILRQEGYLGSSSYALATLMTSVEPPTRPRPEMRSQIVLQQ